MIVLSSKPAGFGTLLLAFGLGACTGPAPRPHLAKVPQSPVGTATMLTRIGDRLADGGDLPGAVAVYRSATERDPQAALPLVQLGRTLNRMGETAQAEAAFTAALSLEPHNRVAAQGLAIDHLREGDAAAALALLQPLAVHSTDASLLLATGSALDMAGRQAEAQAVYRRALRAAPADARLHGNLALSLAVSGDMTAALAEMELALNAPDPDARQAGNAVLILSLAGHGQEAQDRGAAMLGPAMTKGLLARADAARSAGSPQARARLLGLMPDAAPHPS